MLHLPISILILILKVWGDTKKIYFCVLGWGKEEINMHLSLFYIQLYNKKILKVKFLNIFLSSQIRDLSHILTEEVVFTA